MTVTALKRLTLLCVVSCLCAGSAAAIERITPFVQGLAKAAAGDPDVAEFYRSQGYRAIWTDPEADDQARLSSLLAAFEDAHLHALPAGRFSEAAVRSRLASIRTEAGRGRAEAELSRLFLDYAHSVQSGVLTPDAVLSGIKRTAPRRSGEALLTEISEGQAETVLRALPPATAEYSGLLRARVALQRTVAAGGWGETVPGRRLAVGDRGDGVVALRNRLILMGYMGRTAAVTYDARLAAAVRRFQEDHGLPADGIAGDATIAEINQSAEERLGQVTVAMERERWMNLDRGERHVWVNVPDFRATVVDGGVASFSTRVVVGSTEDDRRTPEFSDVMGHMVVNPTWNVPRSIAIKEYLPSFRRNRHANGHLVVYYRGRPVARDRINFAAVTAENWPFELKQLPSRSNALGLVKFMFPNRWNIYLHDTPQKDLFDRNVRAFSHGCVRLQRPFDFAYHLLAPQTPDPRGLFEARLATGRETQIDLETPVPVHLVYRTAFTGDRGRLQFRRDIYGRDGAIREALAAAGVEIAGPRS